MSSALQLKETEVTLLSCGRYYVHHMEICLFYALVAWWLVQQSFGRKIGWFEDRSISVQTCHCTRLRQETLLHIISFCMSIKIATGKIMLGVIVKWSSIPFMVIIFQGTKFWTNGSPGLNCDFIHPSILSHRGRGEGGHRQGI